MKKIAYLACSLDGFIADSSGGLDWLESIPNPNQSDFGFGEFMNSVDAILMGSNTFKTVQDFAQWPYQRPVYVLSNSLAGIPEKLAGKCFLVSGELGQVLDRLRQKDYQRLYVDGGQLIQSLLHQDLLDELILTRSGHLLGRGIPLFADLPHRLDFAMEKVELLNESLCKITYKRKLPAARRQPEKSET